MVMVYKEHVQYFHQLHQQVEVMVVEELVLVYLNLEERVDQEVEDMVQLQRQQVTLRQ